MSNQKMFIDTQKVDKVLQHQENKPMEYIIMMNNELQSKYEKEKDEKVNLEKINEELEQEIDNLSKTRTALQGYMKNEIEYAKAWKSNYDTYKEWYYYVVLNVVLHVFIQLTVIMIMTTIPVEYERLFIMFYTPFYMIVSTCGVIGMYNTPKELTLNNNKNIAIIEKANLYIMDLIDNI